ncbi:MAG: DNA translocase FtsK, partial [Planctomycetota bacterium]
MIAKQPFPVSDVSIRVPATRALGLGLGLAAGFWCAVLVLSHPALAFDTRWPSGADLHPLGAPAAWLARLTWSMFGWAAPLAPLVLAMLSAGRWRRRVGWFLKALGALAVLVALPVVLVPARALEEHLPQSGSGGLWGDWLVAAAHEAGRDGWLIPVAWGMTVLGCLTSLGMGPWQMLGKLTVGKAAPVPNATPATPPKAAVKRTRVVVPPSEPVDKPAEESTEAATAFLTSVPLAVEPALPVAVGPSIPIHHHASTPPVSESVAASVVRPLTDTKAAEFAFYKAPTIAILDEPEPFAVNQHEELLRTRAGQLEQAFRDFGINVKVVGINTGPVITQFELSLETGLRLNKVTRLGDD